jgi:hypothetical protein
VCRACGLDYQELAARLRLERQQERERSGANFLDDPRACIWCRDLTLKLCRWCRGPLRGRQTAYCSELCAQRFQDEHLWSSARYECRRRYGGLCADCGTGGSYEDGGWHYKTPSLPELWAEPWKREWVERDYNPLEVHHIHPLGGAIPRSWSCYNHQANLVPLCLRCHKARHRALAGV